MSDTGKKIRALIVDDEPIARRGIRQQLRSAPDVEIVGEAANGRDAVAEIERLKPDLVFLDIQMPVSNGFGVVQSLGEKKLRTHIVFVTAFDAHAVEAFEINALDYLLKPIDAGRFQKTMDRVRERFKHDRQADIDSKISAILKKLETTSPTAVPTGPLRRITLKNDGNITFLDVDDIDWIASEGNYAKLHTAGGSHLVRETLDGLEARLDPREFLRLRRSTIVRIDRIRELSPLFRGEYAVSLKNGTKLTSSRRYRKNLDRLLG